MAWLKITPPQRGRAGAFPDAIHPFDIRYRGRTRDRYPSAHFRTRAEIVEGMKPGEYADFVVASDNEAASVRGTAYHAGKKLGCRFRCTRLEDGQIVRVFRMREE